MLGLFFMSYNHKNNSNICGILPKIIPIINSELVWAFITSREEATNPFIRIKNAIRATFWV
jgi:hypothetical protein